MRYACLEIVCKFYLRKTLVCWLCSLTSCSLSGLSHPSPRSRLFSQIIQGPQSLLPVMNQRSKYATFVHDRFNLGFLDSYIGWMRRYLKSISVFVPNDFLMGHELMNYDYTDSSCSWAWIGHRFWRWKSVDVFIGCPLWTFWFLLLCIHWVAS